MSSRRFFCGPTIVGDITSLGDHLHLHSSTTCYCILLGALQSVCSSSDGAFLETCHFLEDRRNVLHARTRSTGFIEYIKLSLYLFVLLVY